MLNVNRILVFLYIGMFSSSLYAVDVSNFDIKDIKLGMGKNIIVNKLADTTSKNVNIYGRSWTYQIIKNSRDGFSLGAEYVINLDHNEKSFSIAREIIFKYEPNFNKIKKQLIKKYGKPDNIAESKNNKGDFEYQLCWGDCTVKNATYWKGNVIWGHEKSFIITYRKYSEKNTFYMLFELVDRVAESKEDDWKEVEYERYLKNEKEKASNIDL